MSEILATISSSLPAEASSYLLGVFIILLLVVLLYHTQLTSGYYAVIALMIWFPIENLVLKYTPPELYPIVKYTPEILLYALAAVGMARYLKKTGRLIPENPLTRPIIIFLAIAGVSLVLNWYSPVTWLLGARQILRFSAVYFFLLTVNFPKEQLQGLVRVLFLVAGAEAGLGIFQYLLGGRLDAYLFSTQAVTVANRAILGGGEQFWIPGARAFATMGRYDQLASFLALAIILLISYLYMTQSPRVRFWLHAGLGVMAIALLLTFSRTSWIGVTLGLLWIGVKIIHDPRVMRWSVVLFGGLALYIASFFLTADNAGKFSNTGTDRLGERLVEVASPQAWRDSYEGYGRFFFLVNTPRLVVASAPLFGVGLGNFGGGVAAALSNTRTYDRLKIPFGIEGNYGQIDNSWFAIWGETGTLGLIAWGSILFFVIRTASALMKRTHDAWTIALARGVIGVTIGISVIAFFGPYFEFRTLMFYFWLLAGMMVTLWRRETTRWNFLHA